MAAGTATAIALGVGASANLGTSGALAIGGNKRRRRAEAALRNLVPPTLRNYYSDVPLSTYGSKIASQNMAQNNATMINAAQKGGVRALTGIAPTLTEANIQQNQAIAQDIDRQYAQNKANEAQGAMQVQTMQEQRYNNALAGLQAERSAALQDTYTGLSNLAGTAMSVGTTMLGFDKNFSGSIQNLNANRGGIQTKKDSLGLTPDQYTSGAEVTRLGTNQNQAVGIQQPLNNPVYDGVSAGLMASYQGNAPTSRLNIAAPQFHPYAQQQRLYFPIRGESKGY